MKKSLLSLLAFALLLSCNTAKKTTDSPDRAIDFPTTVFEDLDTLTVTGNRIPKNPEDYELPRYNPSYAREVDLLHTRLDLRFDWPKQRVMGKATLAMRPWFAPISQITLDAKGFDFHSITFDGKTEPLKFDYDGNRVTIQLGRSIPRTEEFKLWIDYTGKPTEKPAGGSAAITSDQGLYFINHDGSDPEKPMQIWTQGETESNSRWMPTVDKPNERCTQEMYLTVEAKFKTLSNGLLISSKNNPDGSRTDYWKMDKPHAPYLFMMAIGDYAVVKDKWRNTEMEYWVEPKFEADAKAIFSNAPEMLEFFSAKLDYTYPWPKLAHVVVRDYVSGAMENTSSIIYGEYVQKTARDLIDNHNEDVVAHETFHQWFGDLVTTESWSNLTLNEGFANYSEYLWQEYKYGPDAADLHLMNDRNGYFGSIAMGGAHDLIEFGYEDKEQMFDAHSYNKGGCVLHMLRHIVGEEAFWKSLNYYLRRNEYTDVESHELRLAFEEVTGKDLNWFWNQWFFSKGHPILQIAYDYDATSKKAIVTLEQTQDPEQFPAIFELPMAVDVYFAAGQAPARHQIRMNKRRQTFQLDAPTKPKLINVDADRMLLTERFDAKTEEEYVFQLKHGHRFMDRFEAIDNLRYSESAQAKEAIKSALADKFWSIRVAALELLMEDNSIAVAVARMADNDPHSAARSMALDYLGKTGDKQYIPICRKAMQDPKAAYSVVSAGLNALNLLDADAAIDAAKLLENETSPDILTGLAELYASNPKAENLPFFEKALKQVDGFSVFPFFENYKKMLAGLDAANLVASMSKMKDLALDQKGSMFKRIAATKTIVEVKYELMEKDMKSNSGANKVDIEKLDAYIAEIKEKETNVQVRMIYEQF